MRTAKAKVNLQNEGSVDKNVKVAVAKNAREKLRIYRLRYQVYVEEMGRQLSSADHKNRLVVDDLDESAFLVYVQKDKKVVGTIRNNIYAMEQFPPELIRMFRMDIFRTFNNGHCNQKFCFTSKYVVKEVFRRSPVAYMLVAGSYEFWRDAGEVQFVFAGCNPYMVPLYERLGFRRFAENVVIPEYGCMVPLVWLVEDESHMRAVGSPFYRNARKRKNDQAAARWFEQKFPEVARFVNSRLVSKDELWLILQEKLGKSPQQAMSVLKGLSEQEAKTFVHIGIIHLYKRGERILTPGDFCNEINILLTGTLEVSDPAINNPLDTASIKSGGLCGRIALIKRAEQTVLATARTEVELFIISGMAFEAFSRSHPIIAKKILQNIGGESNMPMVINTIN